MRLRELELGQSTSRDKQFICRKDGKLAGGVYMWETQADAEAFYTGPWREGNAVIARVWGPIVAKF